MNIYCIVTKVKIWPKACAIVNVASFHLRVQIILILTIISKAIVKVCKPCIFLRELCVFLFIAFRYFPLFSQHMNLVQCSINHGAFSPEINHLHLFTQLSLQSYCYSMSQYSKQLCLLLQFIFATHQSVCYEEQMFCSAKEAGGFHVASRTFGVFGAWKSHCGSCHKGSKLKTSSMCVSTLKLNLQACSGYW